MTARLQGYHGSNCHLKILKIPINIFFNISSLDFFFVFPVQVLLHFLTSLVIFLKVHAFPYNFSNHFIILFYPWLSNTIFLCSSVLPSLPLLLEFRATHAIGDTTISVLDFPFPLTSPSEILLGKELQNMVLPAKSWPRASEDWIT